MLLGWVLFSSQDAEHFFGLLVAVGCNTPQALLAALDDWEASGSGNFARFFTSSEGGRHAFSLLSFTLKMQCSHCMKSILENKAGWFGRKRKPASRAQILSAVSPGDLQRCAGGYDLVNPFTGFRD